MTHFQESTSINISDKLNTISAVKSGDGRSPSHNEFPQDNAEIEKKRQPLFIFLHQLHKPAEKVIGIMWAGGCLGMVLDREDWQLFVPHPLNGLIIQVFMGQFAGMGERYDIH